MNNILKLLIVVFLITSCSSKKTISNENAKKNEINETNLPNTQNKTEANEEELIATSKVKVTKEIVLQYISKYKNAAIENMNNYKIPASITLAQGILESGCGTSTLSIRANNHFGIKCHSNWEGEYVNFDDDAPNECFRKYKNPIESYRDHSIFLTTRKWYIPLFQLNIKDYKAWSYGLKKSGYATDPKYPKKLISIIERYNLNQYDNFYSSKSEINTNKVAINQDKTNNIKNIDDQNKVKETKYKDNEKPIIAENEATVKQTYNKKHKVQKGDTIYNISKKYNVSIEKLKQINKISDSNISLGQELIIE